MTVSNPSPRFLPGSVDTAVSNEWRKRRSGKRPGAESPFCSKRERNTQAIRPMVQRPAPWTVRIDVRETNYVCWRGDTGDRVRRPLRVMVRYHHARGIGRLRYGDTSARVVLTPFM
jgi:hypothetical protein